MRPILLASLAAGLLAAILSTLIAIAAGRHEARQPPGSVEMPDLDRLEARMVQAAEITRRWEELAERSREATPVVCEQMAGVALAWEVR